MLNTTTIIIIIITTSLANLLTTTLRTGPQHFSAIVGDLGADHPDADADVGVDGDIDGDGDHLDGDVDVDGHHLDPHHLPRDNYHRHPRIEDGTTMVSIKL